jgi:predicted TIM-barrel fold metal-dependent hydrolase
MNQTVKKSIINCHTHIFTGKCVPPFIAKSFMPWPLYRLLNIDFLLKVNEFLKFDRGRRKVWYEKWQNTFIGLRYAWRSLKVSLNRNIIFKSLIALFNIWVLIHAFYIFFGQQIITLLRSFEKIYPYLRKFVQVLIDINFFIPNPSQMGKVFFILFTLFFIRFGRKLIFSIGRYILPYMRLIPDSQTWKFLLRYYHLVRFAGYKESSSIYSKLKHQYDGDTGFVVLPMDMHFMGAGTIKHAEGSYEYQMASLAKLKKNKKNNIYPFVFIDPRRIKSDPKFLKIHGDSVTGSVIMDNCFVKEYIEDNQFNGFKIYPALGYYPFDEELLLLWKYAADHCLPIMTHAIKGTVFYRGKKEKEWDYHPVFKESVGKNLPLKPLLLPQTKNIHFTVNFTHPLNYLCLLEEKLLRLVVKNCRKEIKEFFGYIDDATPLKHNLSHLKICMGHYGGEDEWEKYLERDRLAQVSNMFRIERDGFDFFPVDPKTGHFDHDYLSLLWKSLDWFSIISNLIFKYPNVYADISYIIYNPTIYPLLKQVLTKKKHNERVLYGTDFFVVRNHKSEKHLLAEAMAHLTEQEFDQIARENPREFLRLCNSMKV